METRTKPGEELRPASVGGERGGGGREEEGIVGVLDQEPASGQSGEGK